MPSDLTGLFTKDNSPVPLTGVRVEGMIAGRGARVKIAQAFENREAKAIEAVYRFPLPEGSAVCGFRVVVEDRIFEGTVEEREEAFRRYDEALTEGHGGFLLDEERPNIFTLSVGNVLPGEKVSIEIEYVTLLDMNGAEVRFFLPTTISPRYVPGGTPDVDGIPAADLIHPEYAAQVPYGLALRLNIEGAEGIEVVESPSHPISTRIGKDRITVEFTSDSVRMDRDFVLTLRHRRNFESRAYRFTTGAETFLQLDIHPDALKKSEEPGTPARGLRKEVIFVLDCSGSMEGESIAQAKRALEIFLRALCKDVRFNVVRFGSTFEMLLPVSIPCAGDAVDGMIDKIRLVKANLGGTEVLAPLQKILETKVPEGYEREVILVTDGQVGNESEVTALFRREGQGIRVFTVGIGHGANEYFLRGLARAADGAVELIAPGERIEPKVLQLFGKVMSPRVGEIRIDWTGTTKAAEQAPSIPGLFEGEGRSLFARVGQEYIPGEITLGWKIGGEQRTMKVPVTEIEGDKIPIPILWARERIRDLEESGDGPQEGSRQKDRKAGRTREMIIELSKFFGLLSRETSFLSIEKRVDPVMGEIVLRKVPTLLTHGWGGMEVISSGVAARVRPNSNAMPLFSLRRVSRDLSSSVRDQDARYDADEEMSDALPLSVHAPVACHFEDGSAMETLMDLLALQRPGGGFNLTEKACQLIGTTVKTLRDIADQLVTTGEVDCFVLVSTAVVLSFLEERFAGGASVWRIVASKSEKWLAQAVASTEPRVGADPVRVWADRFVKSLPSLMP